MYNRYIPPSKAKSAPQPAASSPPPPAPQESPIETNHVQVSGSVPASSYARYVPPRKSKPLVEVAQGAASLSNGLSPATKRKHEGAVIGEESPAPDTKKTRTNRQSPEPEQLKQSSSPRLEKKKKDKRHSLEAKSGVDGEVEVEDDAFEAGDRSDKKKDKKKKRDKTHQEKEEAQAGDNKEVEQDDTSDAESKPAESKGASATGSDGVDVDTQGERKQKKEKRDKPKKKKDKQPEDEEVSSRHASVLAKKDKALQVAPPEAPGVELDGDDMDVDRPQEPPEDIEMHGLEPLPQPAPVAIDTTKPTFETLPAWLAAPIRVAPDTRTPFSELGIHPKASKVLEAKGFKDAFAVQTAAVPLLLPSCKHHQGDLLVAAATGSGKTLAYALPIARDISQGSVTRLRALVVLPTRELVHQAQEVFQLCANAFDGRDQKRVRIGTSIGSQHLKQDQANLVEKTERYDPDVYRQALKRDRNAWKISEESDSDSEGRSREKHVAVGNLPDHVVDYNSKVDVLICTPGRLVDHINHTPGFTLDYVRWLVVDEADKLLAQSFQGWLDVVMPKLRTDNFSARDFPDSNLSGVRKVILSATLTRDLSLLGGLQLRRPQLIVLEGDRRGAAESTHGAEHTLPTSLKEFAVRVYDPSLKPLYLLDLLQGEHLLSPNDSSVNTDTTTLTDKAGAASDTSSAEDSSETSSSGSDSEAESDSESESESDTSSDTSSSPNSDADADKVSTPASFQKTVLIFTKSNEAALRLSRLLSLLSPSVAPLIATLTSTQKTSHRRRILSSFSAGTLRILVASDLVARGIDLPSLDNVINYDLPASAAGYVHRVGRTARAGRRGRALTLVETKESGWFWGAVGKWVGIRRTEDVGRLRIGGAEADNGGFSEESVEAYQKALDQLGREAKPTR